jgi:chemotaxis protein MotB
MARRGKGREEGHEEGPSMERWLLTYSDMITLLMVLFIVLFALGQTDIRKFNAFKDSFHQLTSTVNNNTPQGGPGILSQPSAIALIMTNPFARLSVPSASSNSGEKLIGNKASGAAAKGAAQSGPTTSGHLAPGLSQLKAAGAHPSAAEERLILAKAAQLLEKALQEKDLSQDVSISLNRNGLVVSILTDKVLFALDSAQLQPAGVDIIDAIAPVLAVLPNLVDVEGDTDNTPIHGGPYASNWALSAARAVAVVTDLIDKHAVAPVRLEATGYGDTRPVVPNNTPQHRAENRRVEIVIFSTTVAAP